MFGGALRATGNVLPFLSSSLLDFLSASHLGCHQLRDRVAGRHAWLIRSRNIPPVVELLGLGLTLVSLSLYVLIRPASDDDEDENGLTRDGLPKESRQRLLSHIERRDYAGLSSSTPRILGAVTSIPLSRKDGSIKASASFGDLSSLDNKIVSNASMMEDFVEPEVYLIDKLSPRAKRLIGILGGPVESLWNNVYSSHRGRYFWEALPYQWDGAELC